MLKTGITDFDKTMTAEQPRRVEPAAEGSSPSRIFSDGELVGSTYEIRGLLGEGGMGQVFEAHDHQLDRRVAIKAAWPSIAGKSLRHEARSLAAFRHPSLVTVHTLGNHLGVDFIVMERIYGVHLGDHMAHRSESGSALDVEEILETLVAIAEGLSVLHRAGFAHRDVKPSNIMFTPNHRVVLMDFGLVLPERAIQAQKTVAGSPPYMPPESMSNIIEEGQGHRIDIYALGVIGFEMLAGRRPFEGGDLEALWEAHQTGRIPDIRNIRPEVSVRFGALITEMLAKDPNERPPSAEAVAFQLRAVRDQGPELRQSLLPAAPRRVLIVEDDADMVRILTFYVQQAIGGAEVRVANNGVEALERVREQEPDVMLLDLHMPKMNGIELGMHLRGERLAESCTIIAVSAGAQQDDIQLLHQLGVHHFVQKGSDLKRNLAEVLRQVSGVGSRVA